MVKYTSILRFVSASVALLFGDSQCSCASTMSYSVNRGIIVDGTTFASSLPGAFSASHSNTNEFGTASASITSQAAEGFFSVSGWAEISAASNEEFSPEGRAVLFFDATFTLDRQHKYDLKGLLVGTSEAEHWQASVSIVGPSTNIVHSTWNEYFEIDETGTLAPGEYIFSARAEPLVLGGLDGGSATAYLVGNSVDPNLIFILTPLADPTNALPEAHTLVFASLFVFLGLASRVPTHWRNLVEVPSK